MTNRDYLEQYIENHLKLGRRIGYETFGLYLVLFFLSIPFNKCEATILLGMNILLYLGITYWTAKKIKVYKAIVVLYRGLRCIQIQISLAIFSVLLFTKANFQLKTVWMILGVVMCLTICNVIFCIRAAHKLEKKIVFKKENSQNQSRNQKIIIFAAVSLWIAFLRMFGENFNVNFIYVLASGLSLVLACGMGVGIETIFNYISYSHIIGGVK